jgi:hypothetical protein
MFGCAGHDVERVAADRVDDEPAIAAAETLLQEAAHDLQPREHFPVGASFGRRA